MLRTLFILALLCGSGALAQIPGENNAQKLKIDPDSEPRNTTLLKEPIKETSIEQLKKKKTKKAKKVKNDEADPKAPDAD